MGRRLILLVAALLAFGLAPARAADLKFSTQPAAVLPLTDSDYFPVVQPGQTAKNRALLLSQLRGGVVNAVTNCGLVADWVPVAGSATGTGTDNGTALASCVNSATTSAVYLPVGDYYVGTKVTWTGDVRLTGPGSIVCRNINCVEWAPSFGPTQTLSSISQGYTLTGLSVNAGGTGHKVGDIYEVNQVTNWAQNRRTAPRIQATTVDGGGGITAFSIIDAGVMFNNPGATPSLTRITGVGTGFTVNAGTWSTPPGIGQKLVTQLGLVGGSNALSADGQTISLTGGGTLAVGDKVKVVSNDHATWNYSNAMTGAAVKRVRVAAGGSGYAVGNVLTVAKFATLGNVPYGVNTVMPNQSGTTDATLTVATIADTGGGTGPVTSFTITNAGSYKYVSFEALALTGGAGSGAQVYLQFDTTSSVGFAEIAVVAKIVDANTIQLERVLDLPHIYDASFPPKLAKLPTSRFEMSGIHFKTSGQAHDSAQTGRVPAALTLLGGVSPVVRDVVFEGLWERGLYAFSTYQGKYDIACQDGVDFPNGAISAFGYCYNEAGASFGNSIAVQSYGTRHCVTSGGEQRGYADIASNFAKIGGSWHPQYSRVFCHGAHGVAAIDEHEDTYFAKFGDVTCVHDAPDAQGIASGAVTATGNACGVIRGFHPMILGLRAIGSSTLLRDDSQNYPFSGLMGYPTLTTISGRFESMDRSNGTSSPQLGIAVEGPGGIGTSHWGGTDPLAKTLIKNAVFNRCGNSGAAIQAQEGVSQVILADVQAIDCDQLVASVGPVTLKIGNASLDISSAMHSSAQTPVINRSTSTVCSAAPCITGAATITVEGLSVTTAASNPSTIFRTLETTAGNSTTLQRGRIVTPAKKLALTSTSGGTITVAAIDGDQPYGKRKIIAYATAVDLSTTGDKATMPVAPQVAKYLVTGVILTNCGTSMTTGFAGLFSASGGGGTALAANQALSALTGTTTQALQLTMAAAAGTTAITSANLFLRVGTAQAGATCDVSVEGIDLTQN